MASSKVASSSASRNSDLRRRSSSSASTKSSSISELHTNSNHRNRIKNDSNLGSMTVDGLLNKFCGDNRAGESTLLNAEITLLDAAGAVTPITDRDGGTAAIPSNKTVDDVWREIVAGRRECKQETEEMMTLEDFLAKAGAAEEAEDEEKAAVKAEEGVFTFDPIAMSPFPLEQRVVLFDNGLDAVGGRGKRRAVLEPLDKAAQQRQRRMIKNRESAARSRERKQAYQMELESLAVKLEEENERLLKEKAERMRERFKQLMEKIVPVVEKRKPPQVLRRVHSMQW